MRACKPVRSRSLHLCAASLRADRCATLHTQLVLRFVAGSFCLQFGFIESTNVYKMGNEVGLDSPSFARCAQGGPFNCTAGKTQYESSLLFNFINKNNEITKKANIAGANAFRREMLSSVLKVKATIIRHCFYIFILKHHYEFRWWHDHKTASSSTVVGRTVSPNRAVIILSRSTTSLRNKLSPSGGNYIYLTKYKIVEFRILETILYWLGKVIFNDRRDLSIVNIQTIRIAILYSWLSLSLNTIFEFE